MKGVCCSSKVGTKAKETNSKYSPVADSIPESSRSINFLKLEHTL